MPGTTAPDRATRACDTLLDAVVVLLASWTVVYQLCFLLRWSASAALGLEAAVLLGGAVVLLVGRVRRPPAPAVNPSVHTPPVHTPPADDQPGLRELAARHPRLLAVVATAAGLAAVAMALRLPWAVVWVPWLVAACAGTVLALRTLPTRATATTGPAAPHRPPPGIEPLLVIGLGLTLAVLSLVVLRPNPDDLFYVNLSQWVAAHGTFPHRDTIYADLTYPLSNWPPLAGYDAGAGALAHLLGVHAATVVYVLVPPIATLASVLALWRLLRAWRVRHVLVAVAAATLFLMFDGTSSYGPPGNLWVTRLWQGKVILLCVVVPVLLAAALRYVEAPTRRRAAWLGVGGVAAIGCSTTGVFLVPVVALAAAAPLVRAAPRRAAALFGAMAGYPLAMAVLTKAVGGRSADDFGVRRQYRFDPSWFGHEVFLDGLIAVVGVGAVLVGCLVVPHPAARVTTAAAAALTGLTLVPGVTHLAYDTVGLGPTLWRLTWSLSIAALVGAAASYAATALASRRVAALGAATVAIALVAVGGHPILSADTATGLAMPPHWQRNADSRRAATWILDRVAPGARVLAPDGLSITVAVTTTAVKTVTPRDYYMYYLRDSPSFDYDQRLVLTDFVNHESGWQPAQVAPALAALDVGVACVYRLDTAGAELLEGAGYTPGLSTETYRCLLAPT